MKYKLLSVSTEKEVNIGDYVQALASSQFYPHIDGFIQREKLKEYQDEECKVIMNGWYMHDSKQWPPSSKISPLFVAIHINSSVKDVFLSDESIQYLKKYQPIGCRDKYTRDLLLEKGVDAYFSGCMTLTLGKNYTSNIKEDKVYFVDPFFVTNWNLSAVLSSIFYLIFNFRSLAKIAKKYPERKSFLRRCLILTTFHRKYKQIFTNDTLVNAEYICQQNVDYKGNIITQDGLLSTAEDLIKKYAKAKLVVTSRIHCALPCLGIGTPVLFTENASLEEISNCRLGGLRDLFNIIQWKDGRLIPLFKFKEKLSKENHPENKEDWKQFAEGLNKRCSEFTKI